MAPITHIVAFKYQPGVSADSQREVDQAMLALKDNCKLNDVPYIVSSKGGNQNSPEGKHHGMQTVFIHEFRNEEELEYYLYKDPAHMAFKELVGKVVVDVVVLDFAPF